MKQDAAAPSLPSAARTELLRGSVVGGRFEVARVGHSDALGSVLSATDQKTGKPVSLRILRASLAEGDAGSAIRAAARDAAALAHPAIVATYGVGAGPEGTLFVATEATQGEPLSALLARRRERSQDAKLSLRGAYDVIAQVCSALGATPSGHGTLRPSVLWVSQAGQVKVSEFGVATAVVARFGAPVLGPDDQAALAPEVKGGQPATAQSDIFGLGAILYQLLTGRSPAADFVRPSVAHPEATEALDAVLLRCLAASPSARFSSPEEARAALEPLMAGAAGGAPRPVTELGAEVETAGPAPARRVSASDPQGRIGARVSLVGDAPAAAAPPRASAVDLSSVFARITDNDAQRWMYNHAGLDHGPMSGRDLVGAIVDGEVEDGNFVLNIDTGVRKPLSEWEDLHEFLEERRARVQKDADKAAVAAAVLDEQRTGGWKLAAAAVIIALLAVAGIAFWVTRETHEETEVADAKLDALYEVGEIDLSGSADLLAAPAPVGRTGRRGGAGATGGSAGSYEDAMNRAVELGDVSGAVDQRQLSSQEVARVMNQHVTRIYRQCVPAEQARGGQLGLVQIDLAIAGSGSVLGASARQGSDAFRACIGRAVRSVQFPSFGAPRMGARFSFNAN